MARGRFFGVDAVREIGPCGGDRLAVVEDDRFTGLAPVGAEAAVDGLDQHRVGRLRRALFLEVFFPGPAAVGVDLVALLVAVGVDLFGDEAQMIEGVDPCRRGRIQALIVPVGLGDRGLETVLAPVQAEMPVADGFADDTVVAITPWSFNRYTVPRIPNSG